VNRAQGVSTFWLRSSRSSGVARRRHSREGPPLCRVVITARRAGAIFPPLLRFGHPFAGMRSTDLWPTRTPKGVSDDKPTNSGAHVAVANSESLDRRRPPTKRRQPTLRRCWEISVSRNGAIEGPDGVTSEPALSRSACQYSGAGRRLEQGAGLTGAFLLRSGHNFHFFHARHAPTAVIAHQNIKRTNVDFASAEKIACCEAGGVGTMMVHSS
jgi:hypothetical protein